MNRFKPSNIYDLQLFVSGWVRAQGTGRVVPPQQNGSCETFVMPLWVSKCPGGSKCQRHTRRLRLGRKPNSVPCAMLKSMGYEMCQGSYMQLRWTLRIYPGMYPHLSSIDVRWWDSMILQPKMEIIKACTGSRLFERFLFGNFGWCFPDKVSKGLSKWHVFHCFSIFPSDFVHMAGRLQSDAHPLLRLSRAADVQR